MILNLEINQPKDPPYTGTTRFEPKSILTGWWLIETLPRDFKIPDNAPVSLLDSRYPGDIRGKYGMFAELLVCDFWVLFFVVPRTPRLAIALDPKGAFARVEEGHLTRNPLQVGLEANRIYYSGRLLVAGG